MLYKEIFLSQFPKVHQNLLPSKAKKEKKEHSISEKEESRLNRGSSSKKAKLH